MFKIIKKSTILMELKMNTNNTTRSSFNTIAQLKEYLPSAKTVAIATTAAATVAGYYLLNNYSSPDLSPSVPSACAPHSFLGLFDTPFENCVPISQLVDSIPLAKAASSVAENILQAGNTTAALTGSFSEALSHTAANTTTLVNSLVDAGSCIAQTLVDKANETASQIFNQTATSIAETFSNLSTSQVGNGVDSSDNLTSWLYAGAIAATAIGLTYAASRFFCKKADTSVQSQPQAQISTPKPLKNENPTQQARAFIKPGKRIKTSGANEDFPESDSSSAFATGNRFTIPKDAPTPKATASRKKATSSTVKKPSAQSPLPTQSNEPAAPTSPKKQTQATILTPSKPRSSARSSGTGYIDYRSFADTINGKKNSLLDGRDRTYVQVASTESNDEPKAEQAKSPKVMPSLFTLPSYASAASGTAQQRSSLEFSSFKPIGAARVRTLLATPPRAKVEERNDSFKTVGNTNRPILLQDSPAPHISLITENRFGLLKIEDSNISEHTQAETNSPRFVHENRKSRSVSSRAKKPIKTVPRSTTAPLLPQTFTFRGDGSLIAYSTPSDFMRIFSQQTSRPNTEDQALKGFLAKSGTISEKE